MPGWRRNLLEQFPEFRYSPESWSLVDAASTLGGFLEKAGSVGDVQSIRRVLLYVVWMHAQAAHDEAFFHFCVNVLRTATERKRLRSALGSSLSEEVLVKLGPVFRYLLEEREFAVLEEDVRLKSRANLSLKIRRPPGAP